MSRFESKTLARGVTRQLPGARQSRPREQIIKQIKKIRVIEKWM
jgi:hypothetical protein